MAALWSIPFSGLGHLFAGQKGRAFLWASTPGLLFAAAVAIRSTDLLFLSMFTGLFTAPAGFFLAFFWLPFFPSPVSPVFWFGLVAKVLCVADAWSVARNRTLLRPAVWSVLVAASSTLFLFWFSQSFVVHRVSGASRDSFSQAHDVVLSLRTGAWVRWKPEPPGPGQLVTVKTSYGMQILRIVGGPDEELLLQVDRGGNISYRIGEKYVLPEVVPSSEFCVWIFPDLSRHPCMFSVERRVGMASGWWSAATSQEIPSETQYLRFLLGGDEVLLLSDFRHMLLDPAWFRTRIPDLTGVPFMILWSRLPDSGIQWDRIGRLSGRW